MRTAAAPEPIADTVAARVAAGRVRLVHDQGRTLVLGAALAATVTMLFAWWWRGGALPWPWLAALGAQACVRLRLIAAYHRAGPGSSGVPDAPGAPDWGARFALGTLAAGLVWSAWALAHYDPEDVEFLLLLSTVYAGMIAVSAASTGAHLPSFLSFSVPLAVPLAVAHLASGRDVLVVTGVLLGLFLAVNVALARRVAAHHAELIRARCTNEELAERLAGEKRVAEAAVVAKSRFLAATSHDLRQPLHALVLFVEALRRCVRGGGKGAAVHEIVEDVASSADALKGLLDALLDLSRLDAETMPFEPVHVRLDDVLDRLRSRFGPQARDAGLELVVAPAGLVAWTDPILLERVLANLLSNAVRYTPRGGVRLEVVPADGGACRIELVDTGIGIPAASVENVFGEYVQLDNPSRDREAGLGLGLSIVRRLCELMDAPLAMESEPGVGTRFELRVPGGDPARVALPETGPATPVPPRCDGALVLVIDDERTVLEATGRLLESRGCTALLAGSAREALRAVALAGRAPDLVLSDLGLGGGASGIDAVAALREAVGGPVGGPEGGAVGGSAGGSAGEGAGRELPAVIVTGDTSPERLREVRDSGLESLCKPVSAAALDAVLARATGAARASGPGPGSDPAPDTASDPAPGQSRQDVARTSLPTVSPCTRIESSTIT